MITSDLSPLVMNLRLNCEGKLNDDDSLEISESFLLVNSNWFLLISVKLKGTLML